MAPPVTPNPRRFLLNNRENGRPKSTQRTPFQPSALRNATPATPIQPRTEESIRTQDQTRLKQFAQTPKFVSQATRTAEKAQSHTIKPPPALQRLESLDSDGDAIQELSQDQTSDPLLESHRADGHEEEMLFDIYQPTNHLPPQSDSPVAKRRRISHDSIEPMQIEGRTTSPPSSPPLLGGLNSVKRFLPRTTINSTVDSTPISHRPSFVLPATSPDTKDVDPLPSHFSPHRKSQHLIQGGLADTMRAHIIDLTAGSAHSHSHRPSTWKFHVSEANALPSMALVKGTMENGREEHLLLASQGYLVKSGDTISVKGINWEVELQDRKWIVCIDWKVER
ncbi:hypothetical protein BT63DRAFT_172621 [Microthyrium microscopicum]|uniref:Uncharacterized protein n=1 Tax=Microthyrium microscopicum TaxID=703497 RepID=A0A6A6UNW3_9PEZI|nr:hypothetical protein BT63DRAFT_172621 [Microthyrium microscopicum]